MTTAEVWQLLAQVPDPELPVVSVVDLGIARDVHYEGGRLVVTLTPTYSGCPALAEIVRDVRSRLAGQDGEVEVRLGLIPPWSSDDITPAGRRRLAAAGIAPPSRSPAPTGPRLLPLLSPDRPARCPRCSSPAVEELAGFGSTACTALWRCTECREPFSYVKAH